MTSKDLWSTLTEEQRQRFYDERAKARRAREADPSIFDRYIEVLANLYMRGKQSEVHSVATSEASTLSDPRDLKANKSQANS